MLDGVMLLWFILTGLSLVFVAIDIQRTPESPVLKWGFVLLTAYTGPVGAFLYVLGCREPLPGLHEQYVATRWRQVLGSTMHCVAGDGVGILAGAVIASLVHLPKAADIALEYALGFGFGWAIFQALAMRDMAGSYAKSLASTFFPELLSMNCLMAGMISVTSLATKYFPAGRDPSGPAFWFILSMGLLVGFLTSYPINWWLVSNHLKHGMITVRPSQAAASATLAPASAGHEGHSGTHGAGTTAEHSGAHGAGMAMEPVAAAAKSSAPMPGMSHGGASHEGMPGMSHEGGSHEGSSHEGKAPTQHGGHGAAQPVSTGLLTGMTLLTFVVFAVGLTIAFTLGG
ncbi:MAG: DUF4396 domain-containing protein [Verrucomicrobiota bacterium]